MDADLASCNSHPMDVVIGAYGRGTINSVILLFCQDLLYNTLFAFTPLLTSKMSEYRYERMKSEFMIFCISSSSNFSLRDLTHTRFWPGYGLAD